MFQFHTGSIKSRYADTRLGRFWGFQFHTGSIKRNGLGYTEYILLYCFNSILVRLKGESGVLAGEPEYPGFNSILVRLKVFLIQLRNGRICTFQFHTGSIKSSEKPFDRPNWNQFQFHTGSIKSKKKRFGKHAASKFQFHTGSIKSVSVQIVAECPL